MPTDAAAQKVIADRRERGRGRLNFIANHYRKEFPAARISFLFNDPDEMQGMGGEIENPPTKSPERGQSKQGSAGEVRGLNFTA
jgi:hypothetical protein